MSTETLLSQAVKGALAFGAAGGLVSGGAALAQNAPPAGTTTNLSKIVVTGSHIPQTAIATAQPVVSIDRQEIENSGFTTVGQLLQSMTSVGAALNVNFNNGGNGAALVNLHNLGAQRVLVLVNGQRWISGLGGTVDLTTIPAGAIQRIDVLLDGASAVYGSEAMAGVVNIITVKNFNGARASAYMGMYDASNDGGGWDGKLQRYHFMVGSSTDRSSVLLGAGYYEQEAVWAGNRTMSKEPFWFGGIATGSSNGPNGRYWFQTPTGQPVPSYPGCGSGKGILGGPGCDLAGPFGNGGANVHPFGDADKYNYAPTNYLRTPSERWYVYSQGHYDITSNVSFHFTSTYQRRNSHQVLAQNPWALGWGGYTAGGLEIGISANNPYNPFGMDLVPALSASSPNVAAWCSKFGAGGAPDGCSPQRGYLYLLGWRPLNAPLRDFSRNRQTFYFNGGFQGYWQMFGNQWSWNADYIYAGQTTDLITTGLASTKAIQKHLGPNCTGTPSNPGDCVALDMFHSAGAQTKAQIAPLMFTAHAVNQVYMRDYNVNIGGGFFNGWYAGPWGLALGYEYSALNGSFSPDAFVAGGNTVGNAASPTEGRENTNAQYIELNVPFARNLPGAQELSLNLANRWSQFHWNGVGALYNPADQSVSTTNVDGRATSSTGRATLKWRPVDQLLIRASWSENFRIPSISELFGGIGDNYPSVVDPCVPANGGAPGCTQPHVQPSGQIVSTIGGYPGLHPESAIQRSVGFVYSPTWAEGLDFSLDYYHIEVLGVIGSNGAQFYVNHCYQQQEPSACQHLVMGGGTPGVPGSGNVIKRIIDLNNNGGSDTIRGFDLGIHYRLPTTAIGQFDLGLNANFLQSDVFCNASGNCSENAGSVAGGGFGGEPKHKFNFSADWTYGAWAAAWKVYLIGPMWEDCASGTLTTPPNNGSCSNPGKTNPVNPQGQNHLGTTIYHDIQASYTLSSWNTTFTLGVLNAFDKKPPAARTAFANTMLPMYRIPGRFWYGRVSVRF